jgi:UDP-N-acetylmuramate dehydrogenase
MASSVVAIEIFDVNTGHRAWVSASDIGFRFRHSALDDAHLVSRVQVSLQSTSSTEHNCDGALSDIVAWRRAHQPGGQNAGSVFVNPGEGDGSAGALIDSLGLRGWRCGTAHVSELHANFVQADQGGSADDVLEVMRHVQQQVSGSTGILLRSEIRLLGFSEDVVAEFSSHRSYSTDDDAVNEARARLLRHL